MYIPLSLFFFFDIFSLVVFVVGMGKRERDSHMKKRRGRVVRVCVCFCAFFERAREIRSKEQGEKRRARRMEKRL